jgi:hypothetical protein
LQLITDADALVSDSLETIDEICAAKTHDFDIVCLVSQLLVSLVLLVCCFGNGLVNHLVVPASSIFACASEASSRLCEISHSTEGRTERHQEGEG